MFTTQYHNIIYYVTLYYTILYYTIRYYTIRCDAMLYFGGGPDAASARKFLHAFGACAQNSSTCQGFQGCGFSPFCEPC